MKFPQRYQVYYLRVSYQPPLLGLLIEPRADPSIPNLGPTLYNNLQNILVYITIRFWFILVFGWSRIIFKCLSVLTMSFYLGILS